MCKFKYIKQITPYIDDAFEEFYEAMLSDPQLALFFENDAQIKQLIKMQKLFFIKSIAMSELELKEAYVHLGEHHYDLRIPYVDFMKGSQMLEEYFLVQTTKNSFGREIMDDIFTFFKLINSYAAKGYLHRMILEDKKDIENFFDYSDSDAGSSVHSDIANEKIVWLRALLEMIESGGELDISQTDNSLEKWLEEISELSLEKRKFIDDLGKRIIINTQNLFYFLQKEDYLEILPLYSSLLGIYKLTFLLNSVLTVEHAKETIKNLKIDPLSTLLRKESLTEFLKKEISYAQREENYNFSMAYLDLDNFKRINDSFGHYSGDKVIEKFGQIIKKSIRGSDIAFRIGGDEFAIIFKNAKRSEAKNVCQKIKQEFTAHEFVFNENRVFSVTTSIGICEYKKNSKIDDEGMIKRVDKKLYEAKANGKNQIAF